MLDSQVQNLIDRLYQGDVRRLEAHFSATLRQRTSHAASIGRLGYGPFHREVAQLYVGEFEARVDLLWSILRQVLSANGVVPDDSLGPTLKDLLKIRISKEAAELTQRLRQDTDKLHALESLPGVLTEIVGPVIDNVFARVDLLVLELRNASKPTLDDPNSGSIYNFHSSTIGVVQSGAGSNATVSQTIAIGDVGAIERALSAFEGVLAGLTDTGGFSRRELAEIVSELKTEIAKPQPNRLKISQFAGGIATAVQVVAALKPAYELVRVALLGWGVNLPTIP